MEKEVNEIRVLNIPLETADKEYEVYFPKGTQFFTLHTRDGTAIRLSHEEGKVNASDPPYWTLKANTSWSEDRLYIIRNLRLYVACGTAAKVVEVIVGLYNPELEETT